jgi:ATP-dependent Clp protease adaptor protein ClpS
MTTDSTVEKTSKTHTRIRLPKKYKVIFCNDDVTPMEFVISVLMSVFNHDITTAHALTMKVHHEGSAVAGIYTHEIAEQKSIEAINLARGHGFPLVIKIEQE